MTHNDLCSKTTCWRWWFRVTGPRVHPLLSKII